MEYRLINVIIIVVIWTAWCVNFGEFRSNRRRIESFVSEEERLYNHLFKRYNKAIRPVRKATEPVQVSLTFSLKQIHALDEKSQMFRTYGWLIVEWMDERLKWDEGSYNNMSEFVVSSSMIWTPELALINAVEYQFPDFSQYRAVVSYDGNVRWEPAGVFETSCKIDITFYPYDDQHCSLVFGTWTYTSYKINMTNSTGAVIQDDYNTSGEWFISGTKVERQEFIYECCEQIRFSKIDAAIHLRRRHRFYTMNLVLPCVMLSSLTLVTFLSPPDQGEKISLGISILLSFSVFMLQLSENMPKTSETLPLFGVYTTFVMLMNTWSVMLTVLILNLHHRHEDRPVPKWVRTIIFDGLARVLCMYTRDHIRNDEFRDEFGFTSSRECYKEIRRKSSAQNNLLVNSVKSPYRSGSSRKKNPLKDSYSLAYAAAQFTGKMRNHGGYLPNSTIGSNDSSNNINSSQCRSNNTYQDRRNTAFNMEVTEECKKELERLLPREQLATIELQEWKRLSRIIDRLFFWLTLLALISVSVALVCLLWAN